MLGAVVVALGVAVIGVLVYITSQRAVYLYHRHKFGSAKELQPLSSHPYAQRLSKLDDLDLAKKRYANIPRDGNCGYHSIIYCIYECLVQPNSTLHRLFLDQRNFHHLKNAGDTAGLCRRVQHVFAHKKAYAQVAYAEAGDLARWLKLLVAAYILESEGQYAGFITPDNTTVKAYVKGLLSTRRNFWMDFPILCAVAGMFDIKIVLVYVSRDEAYITKVGKEESRPEIFLLNTNNCHFEPILSK